jgi:hypothetical protein
MRAGHRWNGQGPAAQGNGVVIRLALCAHDDFGIRE